VNSYDAYWLKYLARRSKFKTRFLHYLGLLFGPALGVGLAMWFQSWTYLLICPLAFGIAWLSRESVWGQKPNPYMTRSIYGVLSFFRMMVLEATGRLPAELKRTKKP
jgi:hypothetical protein